MDKRLAKRHKRQVERAKAKVVLSEPDVRTPEQVAAAREAAKPDLNRNFVAGSSQSGHRNLAAATTGSAAKRGV